MKYLKYSWFVVCLTLVLSACTFPIVDTRLTPTPWEGGPPMLTEEAVGEAEATKESLEATPEPPVEPTAVTLATEEAPQEATTPVAVECLIKANVSANGSMIYHHPDGAYYNRVRIDPAQGDRFYCTEAEAEAEGFRRSSR